MCGIVGYVGSERAAEHVLEGLRRLEYRGYDSAGIATMDGGRLRLRRCKGKLSELAQRLRAEPLPGSMAIGHTRWATHGRPSEENAHPHRADDVVVVHNGIVENFVDLARDLRDRGRRFASETDTEIIAHLIALAEGTLEERVRTALRAVRGAYAIAVISEREPGTMVVAKNASPLVIGLVEGAGMIASDIPALLPHTRRVLILKEQEMAVVRAGEVKLTSLEGRTLQREPRVIDWSPVMAEKGGHKHFMHKEIHEQPQAVAQTLRGRLGTDGQVFLDPALVEQAATSDRIVFTACGTSLHACMVGKLAFEELAGVRCDVELASELRYRPLLVGPGSATLAVAVSQSGETADTLAAFSALRAAGAKTLAVVNVLDSSIARESELQLYTQAGPEIGVASTKAFSTQVAVLTLLAIAVGLRRGLSAGRAHALLDGLRQMPRHIEAVCRTESRIFEAAHALENARAALFLGRGYGHPVALEGALKLKEISYLPAEGYAAGEMKHGPIALVEPGVPAVFVATAGPLYDKIISNIQEVRAREGRVIAVATEGDERIGKFASEVLYVPAVDPVLAPLVTTIPLQLLAYHAADLRGADIDQPRNLAKSVTVE
jgi:glucosamine--fructose-6-phosphate aminotransferase (isomerizing)